MTTSFVTLQEHYKGMQQTGIFQLILYFATG